MAAKKLTQSTETITGQNGVAIPTPTRGSAGYRTYEVYQRERVGASTEKIKPSQLVTAEFANDPYPLLEILREYYPCYRDWLANAYWVTRFDDVTSLLSDEANFETRPKRWHYGAMNYGRDLGDQLPVTIARANAYERAEPIARRVVADFAVAGAANLATEFAGRFALEVLLDSLAIPAADARQFLTAYLLMQRGVHWDASALQKGRDALDELSRYFHPLLAERRRNPGADVVSAIGALELADGPATAEDVVVTLLEADHETLHGGLSNLWFQLLTHPDQFAEVSSDALLMKIAYLETLRHSAPTLQAKRYTRHEVERFGRLLPAGALVICSAAAANRDPRIFNDPDRFVATRRDICHREARGQYRADGLATGIAVGVGPPTKHPAVPEDRPRSMFALTRDAALTACAVLLDTVSGLALDTTATTPQLGCQRLGDMHTCLNLPTRFLPKS